MTCVQNDDGQLELQTAENAFINTDVNENILNNSSLQADSLP